MIVPVAAYYDDSMGFLLLLDELLEVCQEGRTRMFLVSMSSVEGVSLLMEGGVANFSAWVAAYLVNGNDD